MGLGWNFGFSSATIWVSKAYQEAPHLKAQVQAANDCGMFFFSGGLIFSAGYIYGGHGLPGWRRLNYVLLGLTSLLTCIVLAAVWFQKRNKAVDKESEMTMSKPVVEQKV